MEPGVVAGVEVEDVVAAAMVVVQAAVMGEVTKEGEMHIVGTMKVMMGTLVVMTRPTKAMVRTTATAMAPTVVVMVEVMVAWGSMEATHLDMVQAAGAGGAAEAEEPTATRTKERPR